MQCLDKLKIFILNSPYEQSRNEFVWDLFAKTMSMKLKGYLNDYPLPALPIDTTDFVSKNIVICDYQEKKLTPIMGYKTVHYSVCEKFAIPFPAISIAEKSVKPQCLSEIKKIVNSNLKRGLDISYDCSWTVLPEIRQNEILAMRLFELMAALLVHYHGDSALNCPEWITCGMRRFKTDRFFGKLGLRAISDQPDFKHPSLVQADAVMMHLENYSPYAEKIASQYKSFWVNRIDLSPEESIEFISEELAV